MNYEDWLSSVPESITNDSLWSFETYRKALFLPDLAWVDCEKLSRDAFDRGLAWQLVDSAGSIAANFEEGYGREFGKDYARFLRIALGSARESRGWYYRGRRAFKPEVVEHRMGLLNDIIAGLVLAANTQRQNAS